MAIRRSIVISTLLAVAGCASSDGVEKLGPDTYRTFAASTSAHGGSSEARRLAMNGASMFCAKQGKAISAKTIKASMRNMLGAGIVDIEFRCIASVDYVAARPASGAATSVAPAPANAPK